MKYVKELTIKKMITGTKANLNAGFARNLAILKNSAKLSKIKAKIFNIKVNK